MLVTGVQAVGAKGVTAIQSTVVDTKDAARAGAGNGSADRGESAAKAGEPQPVVFPRSGVPLDHRPVSLLQHQAAKRYQRDGGKHDGRDDAA